MNIRHCCSSQLSLFLCDLQSIPSYLVVNCPVGTLSTWACTHETTQVLSFSRVFVLVIRFS